MTLSLGLALLASAVAPVWDAEAVSKKEEKAAARAAAKAKKAKAGGEASAGLAPSASRSEQLSAA